MPLKIGTPAPDFSLQADDGEDFSFYLETEDTPVILYFYPKDFTPGCTTEACEFRDTFSAFNSQGIRIIGVSRDGVDRHRRFKKKFGIPYTLLSDLTGTVTKRYGALMPIVALPKRVTYLIDKAKNIVAVKSDFFDAAEHVRSMEKSIALLRK